MRYLGIVMADNALEISTSRMSSQGRREINSRLGNNRAPTMNLYAAIFSTSFNKQLDCNRCQVITCKMEDTSENC